MVRGKLQIAPLQRRRRRQSDNSDVKALIKNIVLATKEIKRYSVANSFTVNAAGNINPLTQALLVGDTISSRDGDVIQCVKLDFNFTISNPGTALAAPLFCRVMIVRDMTNTGVTPAVADVVDGATEISTLQVQTGQQHRFGIIYDRLFTLVVGGTQGHSHIMSFKLKHKVFYNGDVDAATSNGPGSMWLVTVQDTGNTITMNYYSSLTFTDS